MPICPKCLTRELIKYGKYKEKQRWYCLNCKHTTTSPRLKLPKRTSIKVGDISTSTVDNGEK